MRVEANSTDVSVIIRFVDDTAGTPETGVTSATGGLAIGYWRKGAASYTGLTESDLSNLNDAHSDGGMLHIADGYYRVDIPDAAFASGATEVLISATATGMVGIGVVVEIGATLDNLNDLSFADILAGTVEGSLDMGEVLRIMLSALAGKSDGGGTTTIHFRNQADDTNRITATVDGDGNRTAISVDGA